MYHGKSLADSLDGYSRINGISAGRSVGLRWKEQLRTMYEAASQKEKIAIVVLLDGIDAFLCGHKDEPMDVVEFGTRPVKRTKRNSWINSLLRSVRT